MREGPGQAGVGEPGPFGIKKMGPNGKGACGG
jgi:hypothetical protein